MEAINKDAYFIKLKYHFYGQRLVSSYKNMRFIIHRKPLINIFDHPEEKDNPDAKIYGACWPEPFCYEATDPQLIESVEYPFTDEGIEKLREWLNDKYEKEYKNKLS